MTKVNTVGFADLMNTARADNIFSAQELDQIIHIGLHGKYSTDLFAATIAGNGDETVSTGIRNCTISRIHPMDETSWLYDRIFEVVRDANLMFFNFDLNSIEALQFTRYDGTEQAQFYKEHVDLTKSEIDSQRKLSFTLQLTDASEYDGGELWIHDIYSEPVVADKARGAVTIFPSFVRHEVTPVTRGIRHSLVGWILGPSFK